MTIKQSTKNLITTGDILETLSEFPENLVDLTITSPPYNKRNRNGGWLVGEKKYDNYSDHLPENKYQKWQISVLNELFRITKPGGSLFYNHKIRWVKGNMLHPLEWLIKTDWTLKQEIIWDRTLAANVRGWRFWQVDERIYWLYKPEGKKFVGRELESKDAKMGSIWRIKPEPRQEEHPAPFPIEIPARIISSLSFGEKILVLDPYCGTGTTLVAAKLLGHDYLGIDISETYTKISQQRLDNCSSEKQRIDSELAKHFVRDPFKDRKKRGTVTWPFSPENRDNN